MAAKVAVHYEREFNTLKNGKRGNRLVTLWNAPYCPVAHCQQCHRSGSPTWIRKWYLRPRSAYRWSRSADDTDEPTLCMSCMNRMRPHWRRQDEVDLNKTLINRIKKEVNLVKTQHCRGS